MKEESGAMNLSEEQFERLLEKIGSQQRGSFTTCKATFDGTRDTETVEAFITAVTVFKSVEKIEDEEAIKSMPLVLRGEAATWWNGIKEQVVTWSDFQARIRHAFAPKKPAFMIYQDIIGIKQGETELTEIFVSKKRALFAQLPEPAHPESQQLDMIYGQLRFKIRSKMPRNTITTYDDLLKSARAVERLLIEKQPRTKPQTSSEEPVLNENPKKVRCGYCRFVGHTAEVCRKKAREQQGKATEKASTVTHPIPVKPSTSVTTQAPSPTQPKFSCYGCGAPGVVRSKCPTCIKTLIPNKQEASFCAMNVGTDARSRPVIGIKIGKIVGTAYVDSCAKAGVASFELYQCLRQQGYLFHQQQINVTLADGIKTQRDVLTVKVPVGLCDRVVPTTFIIFPESRGSRTLLGIGFLQDAGLVLNIPQMYWNFFDDPDVKYDLLMEDSEESTIAHVETTLLNSPARDDFLKSMQLPPLISPLSITPPNEGRENIQLIKAAPALPESSACAAVDLPTTIPQTEAALPEASASKQLYRLIPLEPSTPPRKKSKPLFDGYSPSFIDYIYRDAQISTHAAEVNLSPHSKSLFPSDSGSDDVEIGAISIDEVTSGVLNTQQKTELVRVLSDIEEVFGESEEPTTLAEHCIDTGNHNPISVPPYRLSPPRLSLLKQELKKMLDKKVIEPCSSAWTAPVVMVPKKDGTVRVCVDYRRLNAITKPDIYPIPRLDDLLHAAKPTPYMSTLDLRAGYWQVKIKEADQDKSAFITPFGVYRFKRMAFGLRNAPSTFQRLIDRVRISLEDVKMLAYLDDIILFSSSFVDHLADLRKLLRKLMEYNLRVNLDKCRFCCSTIKYLGHLITPTGLKVDPDKVSAILSYPAPANIKHLLTFIQTCSWYRRFIPDFARASEPLTRLTKKNAEWTWTAEQQSAFDKLKMFLTTAPILRQADSQKPYIVKTDASNYALGAVLVQGEGKDEHPVEFASRLLTPAERNYSTTEREALAVVWALSKFRGYIEGLPITVITDHQALKWLMSLRSPTGRLARWALQIQAYDITIKYTPGRTNVVADTLSRPVCDKTSSAECGVCSVEVEMPKRSPTEIRDEQLKDDYIGRIVKALENVERNEDAVYWSDKGYLLNNGLLYRYNPIDDSEEAQLVVPQHEWSNVLSAYHDDPLAGHYGADKTYQRIARRYYWKGMRKYIEAYVKNCVPCQRYKPSNLKPAGLLQTTPMNQRFETVAFDLFGPLPPTASGKSWIFIIEDVATGWVELFAMETASAENCAQILMSDIFLRYGFPRKLISDNGPQFVSAVMQQLTFCLNIKHTLTPVYHPAANPVERKNRDMKTQLAILVGDDHGTWDDKLPSIRFAMNTATSLTTSYTPAYLTFARELRTPDDNTHDFRQIILSENFIPEITPKLLMLANTLVRAKEIKEMKEERQKEVADRGRRKDNGYNPGDLVLATTHPVSNLSRGVSAKFCPRRDGPYLIMNRHGVSSYVLSDPNTPGQPLGVYHTSALTPFQGGDSPLPQPVRPLKKRGRPRKDNPVPATTSQPGTRRGRPRKTQES